MIKEFPELLPQEVIERVKKLNVPLLCDGYKAAGLEKEGSRRRVHHGGGRKELF